MERKFIFSYERIYRLLVEYSETREGCYVAKMIGTVYIDTHLDEALLLKAVREKWQPNPGYGIAVPIEWKKAEKYCHIYVEDISEIETVEGKVGCFFSAFNDVKILQVSWGKEKS